MINLTQNEALMVSGGDLLVTIKVGTEGVRQECVGAYAAVSNFTSYDSWLNITRFCTEDDIDLLDAQSGTIKIEVV